MQRTTTVSLGLFAAWACHDLEELFTMRETSRVVAARMPDWVPIPDDVRRDGLSQQHVNLGISLMGAYLAGVSAVGVRSRGRSHLERRHPEVLLSRAWHTATLPPSAVAVRAISAGIQRLFARSRVAQGPH
jgi:hypothetical protein